MMKITEEQEDIVTIDISGKLTADDYTTVVPALRQKSEDQGKIRALLRVQDIEGISFDALMKEASFDFEHRDDLEKLAVVGSGNLEKIASVVAKPLTSGEVRQFDADESATARQWLAS